MKARAALRFAFAALTSCMIASACLYSVPNLTAEDPEGGPYPYEGGPPPYDGRIPFDANRVDASPCNRCKQTVISSETGTLVAFTLDATKNLAFLAIRHIGDTGTVLEALPLPTVPQKTTATTLAAATTTAISSITKVTNDNRVFFLEGGQLYSSALTPGAPTPLALDDAGAFTPTSLARDVDLTNDAIFVAGSGNPSELRSVTYTTGATVLLGTSATAVNELSYAQGGLYWLTQPIAGTYYFDRLDLGTKTRSENTLGFSKVLAFADGVAVVASTSSILQISPGSTSAQTAIVPSLPAPASVLAAMSAPGSPGSGITAFWSDSSGTGVLREGSAAKAVASVPAISTPTGTLSILFLAVRGSDLYAAGNAGGTAYVVHLAD